MKPMVLLVTAFIVAAVVPRTARAQEVKNPPNAVAAEADAHFEVDPDKATLTFSVKAQEKVLKKAYEKATASMNRVLQLAERNGVAKQDISSGAFTIRPVYDYGDRRLRTRAFQVEGVVTLTLRDFSKVGPLVEGSVDDEITDFRSLHFLLADEQAAKNRAIALATRSAQSRAQAALDEFGRRLGALRSVNVDVKLLPGTTEPQFDLDWIYLRSGMELHNSQTRSASPMPSISPGKIGVSATVKCVFEFQ